jgi:hypothetical protein
MDHSSESRSSNFVRGGLTGFVLASLIFSISYYLSSSRPELGFDRVTIESFAAFVPWRWFWGIVGASALYAFIFNIRTAGFSLWDIFDSFWTFKK